MSPIGSSLRDTYTVGRSDASAPIFSTDRPMELPTKVLAGLLFFILGVIILFLLLLISVATVLTKSNWWIRRRRTCQRRMDHAGLSKSLPIEDKMFYYADVVLEAIALHWNDECSSTIPKPSGVVKVCDRQSSDGTQLPLRFQPEKLYGATSNVHRENERKRSSSFLSIQSVPDGHRRASMIDSLTFLSSSGCLKSGKSTAGETPRLPDYKLAYPQLECPKPTRWSPSALPQIDVTFDPEETATGDDADWFDGSRSDHEVDANSILAVSIPVRRASATNINMTDNTTIRRASFADTLVEPQMPVVHVPITPDEEQSQTGDSFRAVSTLRPKQSSMLKRNSLVEGLSNYRDIPLKPQVGASVTDSEWPMATDKTDAQIDAEHEEENQPLSIDVTESPIKVPHLPPNRSAESPAGQMALAIKLVEDANATNDKLEVHFLMGKMLKSPRPWQRGNFSIKCTFHSLHYVQHGTLVCKDGEFGRLCFPHAAHVTFDMGDRQSKQCATTMNQLKIVIVEGGSKWSTEKEYYHGTISIQLSGIQILTGKPEWYPISPAYPVSYDESLGGFEIHACLTYDGRIVKSKKSVFLQQTRHTTKNEKPQCSAEKRLSVCNVKHRMSFSRTVSGEHYLQFSLPQTKKNLGKMILSNYGIALFVTHKLSLVDQLPSDFVNQLKLIGAPELKSHQAVGECFIADEPTQSTYWSTVSFDVKCDSPCASLWNEAANNGCTRAYQWLTTN
ncbi:hypothetical protein FGIG_10629 [Fasciola gigantica]|uniref:Uncharacterized protein n=1 Tax=Fasciola gigantica TaxID=46835 RepID=A0A504YD31_FASGI|nr:hypothetical protein FGIG_10629 [Fasciola gigantica]